MIRILTRENNITALKPDGLQGNIQVKHLIIHNNTEVRRILHSDHIASMKYAHPLYVSF